MWARRAEAGWLRGTAVLLAVRICSLAAQTPTATPPALARAAGAITAAEVARHCAVFAADSLRGNCGDPESRDAPAPGDSPTPAEARAATQAPAQAQAEVQLRLARYVAAQFRQLGLEPWPPARQEWIQRYPRLGQLRLDYAHSSVELEASLQRGGRRIIDELDNAIYRDDRLDFQTAAYLDPEAGPPLLRESVSKSWTDMSENALGSTQTMVVAGPQTTATLGALDLREKVVIYLPPVGLDAAARRAVLATLTAQSRGVLVASDDDTVAFARQVAHARAQPISMVADYLWPVVAPQRRGRWAIGMRTRALQGIFALAGVELPALRATTTPLARALPMTHVWMWTHPEDAAEGNERAAADPADTMAAPEQGVPYVAGMLEGTDSILKREYVLITANLPPGGDGTALSGLLALARAFSQPGARPRRSVVFAMTSDAPPLLAGSWFLASAAQERNVVLALTLDCLGRGVAVSTGAAADDAAEGTIAIDGNREVEGPVTPTWVAAVHPELGLTVVDTGTVFQPGTMAEAYARTWVPTLALHVAALPVTPSSAKVETTVRHLRFMFYLATELAATATPPEWTALGRQRAAAARLTPPPSLPSEPAP